MSPSPPPICYDPPMTLTSVNVAAAGRGDKAAMTDAELVARYDGRVPRYTTYPTAPHFTPAVDAATYADWLQALPAETALSLYLHVPFCDRLCHYCGCNTTVVRLELGAARLRRAARARDRARRGADRPARAGARTSIGAAARRPPCRATA